MITKKLWITAPVFARPVGGGLGARVLRTARVEPAER